MASPSEMATRAPSRVLHEPLPKQLIETQVATGVYRLEPAPVLTLLDDVMESFMAVVNQTLFAQYYAECDATLVMRDGKCIRIDWRKNKQRGKP